jgi:glycosyltransferase involved in cell wall biosynthesis
MISTSDDTKPRHLALCLFFRAPLGGLQENVLATAIAATDAGWDVSVLCPAGRFIDEYLRPQGIETLAVDFESSSSILQARAVLCRADVIHAHPGPSRTVALEAAAISGAPVVYTIHGAWFDSVQLYAQHLAAIVCVSPAVQEAASRLCPNHVTKIDCIPNGFDVGRFEAAMGATPELGHVVVASRLDVDKRVLINTLSSLWEVQAIREARHALRYTIAGQGTLQGELETSAQRFGIPVHFAGWQPPEALASLYGQASAVIASGRGAIEALAVGRPTLALASAGAVEAFESSQLLEAAHSNFGGYGAKPPQSLEALFERLYAAATLQDAAFAKQARDFVLTHHDNLMVNQRLLDLYDRVSEKKGLTAMNPSLIDNAAVPPAPTFHE